MRVVILVRDTWPWPVLHNCEVSWLYSKPFKDMEQTRNCIWNHQGEITQKAWKQELSFLYVTHRHDLFYIAVKYHDYIPKGIQVIELTQNCIWNDQGEITQKVWQRGLPFLYVTHCHDLFYITIKYHQNILNCFQFMHRTQNCIWNDRGEITQKVRKRGLPFLVETHRHGLFYITIKYHQNILNGFQVMHRTWNCIWNDQGEITQKVWQRGLPFSNATHRHDLLYITIKFHQNILNGFQVMHRTQNCIWNDQEEITQKVWKRELSFLYVPHRHDLFYITVKYHQNIPKGIQITERTQICIKRHQRGDN